ncbi:MAG: SIMPL domain-containing protein [Fibrobacteraceae bacterium]|nr:SIMPL domain-containing protein [Fibrobacteraceae bacterium]
MQSRIKEAIVLALAIVGLGAFIYNAAIDTKDKERTVTVRGLSERIVPADYAIFPIVFTNTSNDLTSLYESVQTNTDTVKDFLLKSGFSEKEISISAPVIEDVYGNGYSTLKARYRSTSVITVATENADKAREIMNRQGELIKKGVAVTASNWQYPVSFRFTKLNDVKPEMIEEATKNARASAIKFAEDSQSKLGKIKKASQGIFSIENRDESTPFIKTIRVVTNVEYYLED